MSNIFTPTNKIRWKETFDEDEIPTAQMPGWPENGPSYYQLEQFWESPDSKDGEWRKIEVVVE